MGVSKTYVIRGGPEGRERLRVLARVMWPTTETLLTRIGIDPGARCLDAGCGGGDVSCSLVRFLLTHLPDPSAAVANFAAQLAPGGVLVVEDIDCRGHFSVPESHAFTRYVDWYTAAAQARGCDPNIGPRLPGLLLDVGLHDVGMNVVQPAGYTGEVKLIGPITLEAISEAVLGSGIATVEEFEQTVDELYAFAHADGTLLSSPRIVQSWGRRAA